MIYIKKIAIMSLLIAIGCSKDSTPTDDGEDPGISNETNLGIYPKPSSGWMGETNPYNTTGWAGDVMPFYENGVFHLYFLHDALSKPAGEGFHDIHEFETTDFVDYDYAGRAIDYGSSNDPDFAVGTGSVIKVQSTYYFYYTGHNGNSGFLANNPRESVLLATSKDLENWTKKEDFIITAPNGYYDFDFRDPHVFYNEEAGEYWMLVSTQTDARKAVVLLFTSSDPATDTWENQGALYTASDEENYLMLEVADIFKMGNYWYLLFSENWNDKVTHYRVADSPSGPWRTPERDIIDGQYFYAGKTVSDGNKRYIMGWTARKSPETNSGNKEFGGNLVIHELYQESNREELFVKAPNTVSSAFSSNISLDVLESSENATTGTNNYNLDAQNEQSKVVFNSLGKSAKLSGTVSISSEANGGIFLAGSSNPSDSFRIQLEPRNNKIIAINNGSFINVVNFDFQSNKEYDFELYVDGSVVVLYVNDEIAFSNRVYNAYDSNWGLYAEYGEVTFYKVQVNYTN
jgi:beta-fructofuranosidase